MKDRYDHEEDFHAKDRKQFRKERRLAQETDRSKFKKTDQPREKPKVIPPLEGMLRGRVVSISGEGMWIEEGNNRYLCALKGTLKKEKMLAKNLVTVGDYVHFQPSGSDEGSIFYIEERFSILARTDITGRKEQLIAANIDQVFIVVSVVEPPLKPSLVDRYLIAAQKGNLHPILLINKIDLLPENSDEASRYHEFLAAYEPLGFPILSISTKTGAGIEALRALMKDKTSVISGQSGVGKSSLLNTAFHLTRKTGELAAKTFKGIHTTSTAELISLEQGGYCIDTPGIRSFGVWDLDRAEVSNHFSDIAHLASECHFANCTHLYEPHCAVLHALKEGVLPLMRYESYRALLEESMGGIDNRTKRKMDDPNG